MLIRNTGCEAAQDKVEKSKFPKRGQTFSETRNWESIMRERSQTASAKHAKKDEECNRLLSLEISLSENL